MKIIKASIDVAAWRIQKECSGCESVLELCAQDIFYDCTRSNNVKEHWVAECCLCKEDIYVNEKDLPKLVNLDIIKNRYVPSRSGDL